MSDKPEDTKRIAPEETYALYCQDDVRQLDPHRAKLKGAKFVTEIKLARLTERHVVLVLYRPDGANELRAGKPVRVADHYREIGEDGAVVPSGFVTALGQTCLPAIMKFRRDTADDLGTLRLDYA